MSNVMPTQEVDRRASAILAVTVLLLFLGTIVLSVSIGVIFGMAWGFAVAGALLIVFGLVTGFSI